MFLERTNTEQLVFQVFWKSRLSGFLIFIYYVRSIFDQFSINFRSFLNVSWDLLGFIENPWNCIEKLYRDHPSRIHQTKKKLAFRVKTTQNSTLNKLQTRTLCSGWFSRFLIFSKKVIFLLNCVNSGSNFRSQLTCDSVHHWGIPEEEHEEYLRVLSLCYCAAVHPPTSLPPYYARLVPSCSFWWGFDGDQGYPSKIAANHGRQHRGLLGPHDATILGQFETSQTGLQVRYLRPDLQTSKESFHLQINTNNFFNPSATCKATVALLRSSRPPRTDTPVATW